MTNQLTQQIRNTMGQRTAAGKVSVARTAFIADRLKDLPEAYQALLGDDPAQWGVEEQAIRAIQAEDFAPLMATQKKPDEFPPDFTPGLIEFAKQLNRPELRGADIEAKPGDPLLEILTPGQAAFAKGMEERMKALRGL